MYTDKISDIIKDLLKMATEQTGNKYRLEVRENLLVIDDYEDLVIQAEYKSARNIESFDVSIEKGYVKCILKDNETISEHDKIVLETIRYQLLSIQEARSKNIQIREERIG